MFKSIRAAFGGSLGKDTYIIEDSHFEIEVEIPYKYRFDGQRGHTYYMSHNNKQVPAFPWFTSRALMLTLEYKKRNLNVAHNLALYYLYLLRDDHEFRDQERPSLTKTLEAIAKNQLWFETYCPELEVHNYTKCILNKIRQYQWVKQIHTIR